MTPVETPPPPTTENYLANESSRIAKGGAVVLMGTVIAQAIGMVTTIWIARALGPEDYGLLTLALATLLPIATLAAIGMNKTVVRFIPIHIGNKEHRLVAGTLFSALLMAGIASILVTIALIIFAPLFAELFQEPRLTPILRVLAFTIPLMVIITISASATRGLKVMHFDAIIKIANPLFRLLAWIAGLLLLANLLNAAISASLFGALFTAITAVGVTYWGFKRYLKDGVQWTFKPLLIYSGPLLFSTLMYALSPRIDRLVLGVVADVHAVGVYSAAASLIMILRLVHSSITMTFSPIVADAYNRVSVDRAKGLYLSVTRWDARLTFVVVVAAILLAQELLGLFGESYSEALLPFIILALAVYVTTIAGPTGAFLQMTNHQRVDAINALLFFILGPILQIGFALWLGWVGVALGVLVTAIALNFLQVSEIRYVYDFHPFSRDHLLFTILSVVILIPCAFIGLEADWPVRLLLLVVVLGGFFLFIYHYRTPSDAMILNTILPKRKFF